MAHVVARLFLVEQLSRRADDVADELRAALASVGAYDDDGPDAVLRRSSLQDFLWFGLPRKWQQSLEEDLALAAELAALLEDLGAPRLAALTRAQETSDLLALWKTDPDAAFDEYLARVDASGLEPPIVPGFFWSTTPGVDESQIRGEVVDALERAIDEGRLRTDTDDWRRAQRDIVRQALDEPSAEYPGVSRRDVVERERAVRPPSILQEQDEPIWDDTAIDRWHARIHTAVPRLPDRYRNQLAMTEAGDWDELAHAIRLAHPEFEQALRDGRDEVEISGEPVNIRLHIMIHGVVARQLLTDDPPEAWRAARRLLSGGVDQHDMLHALGETMIEPIFDAIEGYEPDAETHLASLDALRPRSDGPGGTPSTRRRRTAARKAQRSARKRNRRR